MRRGCGLSVQPETLANRVRLRRVRAVTGEIEDAAGAKTGKQHEGEDQGGAERHGFASKIGVFSNY